MKIYKIFFLLSLLLMVLFIHKQIPFPQNLVAVVQAQTTMPTPSVITPTTYCLGSCPVNTPTLPANPSVAPCIQSTSTTVQERHFHKHERGAISSGTEALLTFFLLFIVLLFGLMGGTGNALPPVAAPVMTPVTLTITPTGSNSALTPCPSAPMVSSGMPTPLPTDPIAPTSTLFPTDPVAVTSPPNPSMPVPSGVRKGLITGIIGKCLDVPGGNSADGTQLGIWSCNGGDSQVWTLTLVAGTPNIVNISALNKCIDVDPSSSADGTKVWLQPCNDSQAQKWIPQSNSTLLNLRTNKCLAVEDSAGRDGQKVQISTCNALIPEQKWIVP